jgi:hypothetical protein
MADHNDSRLWDHPRRSFVRRFTDVAVGGGDSLSALANQRVSFSLRCHSATRIVMLTPIANAALSVDDMRMS